MKAQALPGATAVCHVYDECFQQNFYLLTPVSGEQLAAWIKNQWGEDVTPHLHAGRCIDLRGARIVIAVKEWPGRNSPEAWGILAHECIHAGVMMLENKGITPAADQGETLAYLVQSLLRRFGELLKKPLDCASNMRQKQNSRKKRPKAKH